MKIKTELWNKDFEVETWDDNQAILTKYHGAEKDVIIPEGITTILPSSISNNSNVVSVKLPQTITTPSYFGDFTTISGGFDDCPSLEYVEFPESVDYIDFNHCFNNCPSMTKINITTNLKEVNITHPNLWYYKSKFKEVVVSPDNPFFYKEGSVVFGPCAKFPQYNCSIYFCDKNIEGEYVAPDKNLIIEKFAFAECEKLTSFAAYSEIVSIGLHAFHNCKELKEIIIPNETEEPHLFLDTEQYVPVVCKSSVDSFFQSPYWRTSQQATKSKRCVTLGYMRHPELHTEEMDTKGKHAYAIKQRRFLIPIIFELDDPVLIKFYIDNNMVNEKNFFCDYLQPAREAHAYKCVEYLFDWAEKTHLGGNWY